MRKYVSLHYLHADHPYDMTVLRRARHSERGANYTPMIRFHIEEMMSDTPAGAAWELYMTACGPDWHNKLRRAVRPGDCFTFNEEVWVFILAQDSELFEDGVVADMGGNADLPLKILHVS